MTRKDALEYLIAAATAILENPDIECRGDEDCDHCVLVDAIKEAETTYSEGDFS